MSKHLPGLLSPIAAMVAILATMTTPARADLEVILQETGFTPVYFSATIPGSTGGASIPSMITFGDFTITSLSASQKNAAFSNLQASDLTIENNTGTAHSLTITTYGNNFTLPSGSHLLLTSSAGGNIFLPGTKANTNMTHQGYINNANPGIDPPPTGSPPGLSPPKETTPGAQPPSFSGISFDNGTLSALFTRTGASYSMTSVASVNVGGSAGIHFTETLQVSAFTPEPASWALAALGVLGLVGYGLRQRKALSV
jgi:hypothetical protein